ncbi:MAG TPA: NrsF family protein [Bryobacteraceae bacterium]|nr:NrsF family protein [Bryobacteraceae bacterium]
MNQVTHECRAVDRLVEERLLKGGAELSPAAQDHIGTCPRCRNLYRTFSQEGFGQAAGVPGGATQRIAERLRSTLKPVRPLPPSRVIACAVVVLFVAFSAAIMMRINLAGIQVMSRVQVVGVSALLLVGLALLALSLARQMRPGSAWPVSQSWLPALAAAGLGAAVAALFPWETSGDFVARGSQCLRAGLLLAVPAAIASGYIVSRGALLDLNRTGATVGAIAGWLGLTVLQYKCDLQNAAHLLVWHLGVVVVSTLVGAAIGRILAHRSRSL